MNGEDKTFYNLEPIILKNIDSISDRDLTHLMYAYSIRAAGNPELYAAFDKKLMEIAGRLDYPGLFNAIYYLMFRESKCQATWDKIIDATINQDETLPITYYRPFKASYYYLKGAMPETKFLREYQDMFFDAEQYFSVIKNEDYYMSDTKYKDFKAFLTGRCLVYPIHFQSVHNLFTLHYVFNEQKIAINYHLEKFLKPDNF